jgi:DNA-binding MarR family transcriptional regulator
MGIMTGQGDASVLSVAADQDLTWALHHLAVASAAVDTVLARQLRLSASDYLALKHLLNADPPIGPVELGRLLGISSGSATSLIDRLEQARYVERQAHPLDRRRVVVRPSSHAIRLVADGFAPLKEELDELTNTFTGSERATIQTFLTKTTTIYRHFSADARLRPRRR